MPEAVSVPAAGATLPDLPLIAPDGAASTLHAARDGRRALVLFMRSSTCPVCHAHVREIVRLAEEGDLRGAAFLLVTPGEADEARTVRERVRSDIAEVWASGRHHADVGLGTFLTLQHSGSFVLDADGTVRYSRASALPTGSFSRVEALEALAEDAPPTPRDRGRVTRG